MKQKNLLLICVIIAIGFVLGAGAFTFYQAKGFSYFSNDSKACNNCHIMNEVYRDWGNSSHKAYATCNDCHIPSEFISKWATKAKSGFSHAYAFTFKDLPSVLSATESSKVDIQNNCIRCHAQYAANAINPVKSHNNDLTKSLKCISCHQNVGHRRGF